MRMKGVVCAGRVEELQGIQLGQKIQFCTGGCEEKDSWKKVRTEPPFREDLRAEAE
jgi:hypothetical protein